MNNKELLKEALSLPAKERAMIIDVLSESIKQPKSKSDNNKTASLSAERSVELLENEERLRTLINATPDIICFKDGEGRWLEANKADLELFQLTDVDYRGKKDSDLAPFTHALYRDSFYSCEESDNQAWEKGELSRAEESIPTPDGEIKYFDVIKVPVYSDNGSRKGLIVFGRDITEAKKLEHQLRKAEKMKVIGLMAGGVAHDLNNILSGIIGYPELLLLKLPLHSKLRQPIEAIQKSGQRAAAVVADLLTVARGVASIKEPVDLNVLVKEYSTSPEFKKLQSQYPTVACQFLSNESPSFTNCSPVHVAKCIMNLVINAFEATSIGGTVTVTVSMKIINSREADTRNLLETEYVIISVSDTGSGISDKDIEYIFEPFYSKKIMGRSGTGLGLAIVWNTMEDHNGKVLVKNEKKGTCFDLYFPVSKTSAPPQTANETVQFQGNGEHILIVDDEPYLLDIASQMLNVLGYTVDTVNSGEEAVKFVAQTPVDVVVLDMLMEPGINGYQTLQKIFQLYPDQKAIIASGFSESEDVKATLRIGATGFVTKPYSIEQLGQLVKNALTH